MSGRGQKPPWGQVRSNVRFARKQTSIDDRQGRYPGDCRHSRNGIYGMSALCPQSALTPANLITLAHFSVSSVMSLPKSLGEPGSIVPPRSARRAFILGSARAALISRLSLSTFSVGVFL